MGTNCGHKVPKNNEKLTATTTVGKLPNNARGRELTRHLASSLPLALLGCLPTIVSADNSFFIIRTLGVRNWFPLNFLKFPCQKLQLQVKNFL